jgi:hypothetical protein
MRRYTANAAAMMIQSMVSRCMLRFLVRGMPVRGRASDTAVAAVERQDDSA